MKRLSHNKRSDKTQLRLAQIKLRFYQTYLILRCYIDIKKVEQKTLTFQQDGKNNSKIYSK